MKVAVVHEWLLVEAGAEKVLGEILKIFPKADLFCLLDFLPTSERDFIDQRPTTTSFIQKLPFAKDKYRWYLPLMPLAVEQFDLSSYDLVISSNYAVAKGVITGPDQLHISYIHSPMRYAWDLQLQYLRQSNLEHGIKSWIIRWLLHKMRLWDSRTAHGMDYCLANSKFVARRIRKVYGRKATVIYPPVDTIFFTPGKEKREDFYLTVSRLVPYKHLDILVKAFARMPESRLVVIGSGPEKSRLRNLAGSNVTIAGQLGNEQVRDYMQRTRAFLFAAEEDFGIVPLEAQACGTPVIAYGRGGIRETICPLGENCDSSPTGIFFPNQTTASVIDAIRTFEKEKDKISVAACRANAMRFSSDIFCEQFGAFVKLKLKEFYRENRNNTIL